MDYHELFDSYKKVFIIDGKLTELGQCALTSFAISCVLSFINCMIILLEE